MPHTPIEALLKELDSPNAEEAWAQFLSCYSAHIYQVIRHLESDIDHSADCFQYVCEQLIENRSRRLRKFKGEGAATFVTWLRAVVRNLCIDWHRKQFGRQRQFRAIARLPVFDQEVFRIIYERAIPPDECLSMLTAQFPNTTTARIDASRARIENLLTTNQRWLLTKRMHAGNGNELTSLDQPESFLSELPDSQPDPEAAAITNERRQELRRALAQLSPGDRLLIRLRFEEGLTLDKAAEVLGLGNAQRADRQVKAILERLTKLMS
jgi:RNA polymerase sigma factor (sigma-70 family)